MQRSLWGRSAPGLEGHAAVCARLPEREKVGTQWPDEFWRFVCPECGWVGEPFLVRQVTRPPE